MNPIVILVLLILILMVVQALLYRLSCKVKHSKRIILLSYLVLYLLLLPLWLLPAPPSPTEGGPRCGMPMVAVMFGRIIIAVLGVIFTLVTHATYWTIAKTNKFVKQQERAQQYQ